MKPTPDTANRHESQAVALARRGAPAPTAFAFTVTDTCYMVGIGRTTAYALIKAGSLRKLKIGRKTLICGSSLRQFLATLGANPKDTA
jgi:excisionase family DNA binding protein